MKLRLDDTYRSGSGGWDNYAYRWSVDGMEYVTIYASCGGMCVLDGSWRLPIHRRIAMRSESPAADDVGLEDQVVHECIAVAAEFGVTIDAADAKSQYRSGWHISWPLPEEARRMLCWVRSVESGRVAT